MPSSSGGAAGAAGHEFQSQTAAYYAVRMLCAPALTLGWDLPSGTTVEAVRCETQSEVDDVELALSTGGIAQIQAKRSIDASRSKDSPLAQTLRQFVDAYLDAEEQTPLGANQSRLVLVTSVSASRAVREDLPTLLARAAGDASRELDAVAQTNARQRTVWPVVLERLREAWMARRGQTPTDNELRRLLKLLRVQELDFGPQGRDEGQAKAWLIDQVLENTGHADLAWSRLTALMLSNAAAQRGINRTGLVQTLTDAQVKLRQLPSVRDDVLRLLAETDRMVRALEPLAEIKLAHSTVKLQRSAAAAALTRAVEGSCLLVGQPGGGKSGVLYDAVIAARDEGLDVVVLAADRFSVATVHDIESALELDRPFTDVLAGWSGERPGIVFVDALDAARGGEGPDAFIQLLADIRQLDSRWVVAASIRTFDLRYRPDLQRVFRGDPGADLVEAEFRAVRHLQVPPLDDTELGQLRHEAPVLAEFLDRAPAALVDLVRNPFNLARLAELLDIGVDTEELNQVATQLQLLDVYWRERVLVPSEGTLARERVLTELCERAIQALRLSAPRVDIGVVDGADRAVEQLLRSGVLVETTGPGGAETFALSHHLLFDYATERLLLRRDVTELVDRLRAQPDLALIARPSLTLHFQWLWQSDRNSYWTLALRVAGEPSMRLLARLVGPAVAAEVAAAPDELDPLIAALRAPGETAARAGEVLKHLIGARVAAGTDDRPLQGTVTRVWSQFAVRLVPSLGDTVDALRILVWGLVQEETRLSDEDLEAVGVAARGLLRFALDHDPRDTRPLREGIDAVAQTFSVNPAESEALLRRLSDPDRLAERGHAELFTLAGAAEQLHDVAPSYVADLYQAAFAKREQSDEPTQMTGGVVALTSTRRQDYDSGLHVLSQSFPDFLRAAPVEAVRALIATRYAYAAEHGPTRESRRICRFAFRGQTAEVADDYSLTWDYGSFDGDHDEKLLNAFEKRLDELADAGDRHAIETLLDTAAGGAVPAAIWRRILRVTAGRPEVMAPLVREAFVSPVLLTLPDTQEPAARALVAVHPRLGGDYQEKIDEMIASLPQSFEDPADGEDLRDQLRGALSGDLEVPAADDPYIIADDPGAGWRRVSAQAPEQAPEQRRFDALLEPVKALSLAPAPPLDTIDWKAAIAAIRALEEVSAASNVADHRRVEADAFIAAACLRAASREPLPNDEASRFAAATLTGLAEHPRPEVESNLAEFDESGFWGVPAPRVDAAKGLLALGRAPGILDDRALAAIRNLAADPAAAVRMTYAAELRWLRNTDLDLTWELAERIARDEPSRLVQRELLRTLAVLATIDRDRALNLALDMHSREAEQPEPRAPLQATIGGFLIDLSVWTGAPHGDLILDRLMGDIARRHKETEKVLFRLREATTAGETTNEDDEADVRRRAIMVFEQLLGAALDAFDELVEESHTPAGLNLDADQAERFGNVTRMIDTAATEVYFASGTYVDRSDAPRPRLAEPKRRRFYQEGAGLLDLLTRIAWPPRAVHHVLETFQESIGFDPQGVLLRIGQLIHSARDWGYQNDSLAQRTFLEIVQTYLAEHRRLLADDQARIALLDSLDAFVDAGWPAARRLVYRLDEAFR